MYIIQGKAENMVELRLNLNASTTQGQRQFYPKIRAMGNDTLTFPVVTQERNA